MTTEITRLLEVAVPDPVLPGKLLSNYYATNLSTSPQNLPSFVVPPSGSVIAKVTSYISSGSSTLQVTVGAITIAMAITGTTTIGVSHAEMAFTGLTPGATITPTVVSGTVSTTVILALVAA